MMPAGSLAAVAPGAHGAVAPALPAGTSLHALSVFRPDQAAIEAAIVALEAAPWPDRHLDGRVFLALGWRVQGAATPRSQWLCRSPLATHWQPLPRVSAAVDAAARVLPWGWSWGCGARAGLPFAWAAQRHPLREGVPFFEASGATPALALLRAALFAQRWRALRDEPQPEEAPDADPEC